MRKDFVQMDYYRTKEQKEVFKSWALIVKHHHRPEGEWVCATKPNTPATEIGQ